MITQCDFCDKNTGESKYKCPYRSTTECSDAYKSYCRWVLQESMANRAYRKRKEAEAKNNTEKLPG